MWPTVVIGTDRRRPRPRTSFSRPARRTQKESRSVPMKTRPSATVADAHQMLPTSCCQTVRVGNGRRRSSLHRHGATRVLGPPRRTRERSPRPWTSAVGANHNRRRQWHALSTDATTTVRDKTGPVKRSAICAFLRGPWRCGAQTASRRRPITRLVAWTYV